MSIEKVLYRAQATATGGRDGRAVSSDNQLDVQLSTPRELGAGELERLVARLFAEIESIGRAAGAKVVFVLLPNRYELNVYAPDETFYLSKYGVLKRLLREGKHETLDFYPELLRHPRAELDEAFQSDSSHFTAKGHRLLADYLLRSVEEKGYLR